MVRGTSRDRRPPGARADRHQRAAAHGDHCAREHAVPRSAVPVPARVGAGATVSASGRGSRGRRSATPVALEDEHAHLPTEMKAMHLYDVDATMEDTELLGMAFHGQQFTLPVYGYHDVVAYRRRHRRIRVPPPCGQAAAVGARTEPLAVQGAAPQLPPRRDRRRVPRRQVRDDPSRSGEVGAVVGQHRVDDLPARGQASAICTDSDGRWRTTSASVWRHAIAARARLGEDRFVDVHHRDLIADPMREVSRVYEFIGCQLTPAVAQAIEAWQVENRVGAHGTHRYTPEQFGLSAAQTALRLRVLREALRHRAGGMTT